MSNKQVVVMRVQPPGICQYRIITDIFSDIPAFPHNVTDDANNTYVLHSCDPEREAEVWYCAEQKSVPTRITLRWVNGDTDTRNI